MSLHQFVNRRTRELHSRTRSEIIMSTSAAVFFVAVIAWRFSPAPDRLIQLGLLVAVAWVLVSLYRFRDLIRDRRTPATDTVAATGLEYYRRELERRRDHLRNEWIWHGPLAVACVVLALTAFGEAFGGFGRLRNVLPLAILVVVWTVASIRRRRLQARELQREIDEISVAEGPAPEDYGK